MTSNEASIEAKIRCQLGKMTLEASFDAIIHALLCEKCNLLKRPSKGLQKPEGIRICIANHYLLFPHQSRSGCNLISSDPLMIQLKSLKRLDLQL